MLTSITNLFQEVDQDGYFGMKDHQKNHQNHQKKIEKVVQSIQKLKGSVDSISSLAIRRFFYARGGVDLGRLSA